MLLTKIIFYQMNQNEISKYTHQNILSFSTNNMLPIFTKKNIFKIIGPKLTLFSSFFASVLWRGVPKQNL